MSPMLLDRVLFVISSRGSPAKKVEEQYLVVAFDLGVSLK